MRDILFRGKDIFSGEWRYGFYYKTTENVSYIMFQKPGESFQRFVVHGKTVGQYTGLKDREGKKIFEGDIMEMMANTTTDTWKGEVIYLLNKAAFVVRAKNMAGTFTNMAVCESYKNKGNIHDNQELLEEIC